MKLIWEGTFTFQSEGESPLNGLQKSIRLELDQDHEGGLSGILIDNQYALLTSHEVKVTGFTNEGFLSLVAIFPFSKVYLENGELDLDKDRQNQEMAFYGDIDAASGIISGTWEIAEKSYLVMDTIHVAYTSGTFNFIAVS